MESESVAVAPSPSGTAADLVERIASLPPADAASFVAELPPDQAASLAAALDAEVAARVLSRMDRAAAAVIVSAMDVPVASGILEQVPPDDRVDILELLPEFVHDELIRGMDTQHADEVRQLESYPANTAGGLMTTQVSALFEYVTAANAISILRQLSKTLEQFFYLYVINQRQQLVGVMSMRDLILAEPDALLRDVMKTEVRAVPATMPQEEVAALMRKYGFVAMPVLGPDARLIGIITLDDVVKVYETAATEEVQRMFGAGAEERLSTPWQFSLRKRFWWLEVNLGTAFLGAEIVSLFTTTIEAFPILAAYLTIVGSMGANAGAQAMAVAIRGIATGEGKREILARVLKREFMVGLISGIAVGLTTAVLIMVLKQTERSLLIGTVVCVALVLNHVNACVTGVCVPFLMKRLGFDPAQSASIIATTFTDCGGFLFCLGLARVAMYWVQG